MLKCCNWSVALYILVSITYLAGNEALQENVFQRHYTEHRKVFLQKRDVYSNESYGQSKSQIVEVKIPACKPKKHYVTSYISETLAVRSHCVQKVTYSSTREVVSSSTECEGYLCNPKIPYEYSKDDAYRNVDTVGNFSYIPKSTSEHSTYDSYSNIYPVDNNSSDTFENYSLPEESYSGNNHIGYGPPKQYSIVGPSDDENNPLLSMYEANYFPEVYNSVDSAGVQSDIVTPETTPFPTTTATSNSYNTPRSNRNYTALLNNLTSIFRDGFLKGFHPKPQIASSVSPTIKPTYFTAVVKDPGHVTPSSYRYAISPSSSIPQITSSTYQPTSLDLSYYPKPIPLV